MTECTTEQFGKLDLVIKDLKDRPIPDLEYQIHIAGKVVTSGKTDSNGKGKTTKDLKIGSKFEVHVKRKQGDFKKVAQGTLHSESCTATLKSPKIHFKVSTDVDNPVHPVAEIKTEEEIGFLIVKQKIELDRLLGNLYVKKSKKQFDYIKEINPHIDKFAMPGDMLILMKKPLRELSDGAKADLKEAQKEAREVAELRKTFPETNEQAGLKVELAAVDTSYLGFDFPTTECTTLEYGCFESVESEAQPKEPTQQDLINFFQPILEKGCTDDPTNCATTGVGAYLAARDPIGGETKALDQLKAKLDALNELMADHAKNMNANTSRAVKDAQRSEFIKKKRILLEELKSKVNKNMMKAINIPTDSKLKTNLGLSTKSNIHQARGNKKIVGVKGNYASQYKYVAKLSKLLKLGGYVAAFIGTAQTIYQAYAICSIEPSSDIAKKYSLSQQNLDDACAYQKVQSFAKSAGLFAGGMGGGTAATYLVCNLAFGLESGGTSFFWCALVAGGAGAAAGSYVGAEGMGILTDKIEKNKFNNEVYMRGEISAAKINGEEALYQ